MSFDFDTSQQQQPNYAMSYYKDWTKSTPDVPVSRQYIGKRFEKLGYKSKSKTKRKYRSRYDIIYDLLNVLKNRGPNVSTTTILNNTGLSHKDQTRFLIFCIEKGFCVQDVDPKTGKHVSPMSFSVLHKGMQYVKKYDEMMDILDEDT